jgi:hypothetical protein
MPSIRYYSFSRFRKPTVVVHSLHTAYSYSPIMKISDQGGHPPSPSAHPHQRRSTQYTAVMGDAHDSRLTYFHRHQSQEDKDLIGDITPRLIKNETKNTVNRGALSSASWNAAETWEERDYSEWSFDKITDLFSSEFEISSDGCIAKISSLGKDLQSQLPIDLIDLVRGSI